MHKGDNRAESTEESGNDDDKSIAGHSEEPKLVHGNRWHIRGVITRWKERRLNRFVEKQRNHQR